MVHQVQGSGAQCDAPKTGARPGRFDRSVFFYISMRKPLSDHALIASEKSFATMGAKKERLRDKLTVDR